jgi:hypothetical protein
MTRASRTRTPTFAQRQARRKAWVARRRLLVRVRPMALAAAVALGATSPMVLGQTVITPLKGTGQTNTVVSTQGNQTTVSTQSLRDGNAFSTYSNFAVGQGDQVKMLVPQGANWWVNIVRDAQVRVDGRLESRLANGNIGGNLLFIDSHGFAVGPQGQIDTGRLSFAAPSTTFVDGLLGSMQNGGLSGATVNKVLGGEFDRSATGTVNIQGRVNAAEGVSLMAGYGGTDTHAVNVSGQVVVNGRVAGSAVNLGDLKSLAPMQDVDGVIDITTPGSIMLNGLLISDSAQFTRAGAVRVVAGQDIMVTTHAKVSASGSAGSGQAGGQVALMAQRDIANEAGAKLYARGDGAGAGGFIEYSALGMMQLNGMHFDAGSQTGVSGQIHLDPTLANITGTTLTGGADITYDVSPDSGDTLTVKSGAIINTRKVADDALATDTAAYSTGNSGTITLRSPNIVIESGALLDASVKNNASSTYSAGDINLIAKQSSNWGTFVSLSDANASINVAGTLKARDINMLASIESQAVYGGALGSLQQGLMALTSTYLESPVNLTLAYVQATGNAKVTLTGSADVQASRDLSITAKADRYAGADQQVEGSAKANLGAGFARVTGTTEVDVQSGASLSAGHDMSLLAASKTKLLMTSTANGDTNADTGASNVASIIFAGSMSDVSTTVKVGSDAVLNSGNNLNLQSYHSGQYSTEAEVNVYGGGTAGVVGALSLQKSDTRTTLDGSATAGGEARLTAMNFVSKSAVSAKSKNTSDKPPLELPPTLETSDAEAQKGLMDGFMKMASAVAAAQEASSGNTSSASSPQLRMAGALAWGESDHATRATLGAGASLVATGNAIIDAQTLAGAVQGTATAEATSKVSGSDASAVSLSVAFNYNKNNFDTQARVGSRAALTGLHVTVNANTDMPEFYTEGLPFTWDDPYTVYSNLVGGLNPFFEGFNTNVAAKSSAKTLAASGAVSLSFNKNNTVAWVDTDAHVTATAPADAGWSYNTKEVYFDSDIEPLLLGAKPYRLDKKIRVINEFASETREVMNANGTGTGVMLDEIDIDHQASSAVVVKAQNHVQTLHAAGGEAPESGSGGTAVGGTFTMVDRQNVAVSGIADRAVVNASSLSVLAQNKEWLLSVSATAGAGEGVAANAMASYNKLSETALASISREAQVTVAGTAEVKAEMILWSYGISGAVTKSSNSGVGIGLALNEIKANTKAYIGDNDSDAGGANTDEGAAGFVRSHDLTVLARNQGEVGAVGVAGAMAGGPAKPGLADKADAGSSSSQAKAGGGSTSPLSAVSGDLQSQSGGGAGGGGDGASTPPKFSVAGAGAIITNFTDIDATALIDGAVIQGVGQSATRVKVRAVSDLTQLSLAGGGALTMASNPGTSFSSSIAGAVAIQSSDDDVTARINNSSLTQIADEAGAFTVQALKSGERTAVATGISANLSKGSTSDLSIVGSVSITHVQDDTAASVTDSTVTGIQSSATQLDPSVVAYDRSRVGAGGGALSVSTGKGSAGVGATISLVDQEGSTSAVLSGGHMTQVRNLSVAALSSQKVVGVGAVAGVQTDSSSKGQLMGAFVINDLSNSLSAGVKNGAVVNLSGDLTVRAGGAPSDNVLDALLGNFQTSTVTDYDMKSAGNGYSSDLKNAIGSGESVVGVAGTLSVSLGSNAASVGLSYVQNSIQTTYSAELNGDITATGNVDVNAYSRANIVGVSAGIGATKGKFSGMGSASVNMIGQRTEASVTGGTVRAASLDVDSATSGNLFSLAGNLSIAAGSGSGSAGGGAVSYTQTGTRTYTTADSTYIVDGVTVTESGGTFTNRASGNSANIVNTTLQLGTGDVNVKAHNTSDIQSLAASGAVSDGKFAFTGTATWNEIGDVTDARISGSTVTAGDIKVQAGDGEGVNSAKIQSIAGGLAASKGAAISLAFGFNTVESSRNAQISGSVLNAASTVSVLADAAGSIETLSFTVAASDKGSLAGAFSTNWLNGRTTALVDDVTFNGAASSLTVHASNSGDIKSLSGALSISKEGLIGGAVSLNLMGEGSKDFKVNAKINNSRMNGAANVMVDADLGGDIGSIAAASGSVTRNLIDGEVTAEIAGLTQNASAGDVRVQAEQTANIASLAGSVVVSYGGTVLGGAVSVNDISSQVTAKLGSSTLKAAGAVNVLAGMDGEIKSVAAAGGGSGTKALNGSVTTNSLTSSVKAQVASVTQSLASSSMKVWAHDDSTIKSFAGTVTGGGQAAGGAALALNFLGRTADNADASKVVLAEVTGSTLKVNGALQVLANSSSDVDALGLAAAGSTSGFAITGSNTTNILQDSLTATWSGSTLVGTNAGSLEISAADHNTINSLAGNFSGSATSGGGAALAINQIFTNVSSSLSGTGAGNVSTGDVVVQSTTEAVINTVAVGVSGSSNLSLQGSVAVSKIASTTAALINNSARVVASDSVAVAADTNDQIMALAGAGSLSMEGIGAAGGILVNMVTSTTSAGIDGSNTYVSGQGNGNGVLVNNETLAFAPDLMNINKVNDLARSPVSRGQTARKGVTVQATSVEQVAALTEVISGGSIGAGAAMNVDNIGGTTRAYVDSAKINTQAGASGNQQVRVLAADHALIAGTSATLAIGEATGVAGAMAAESIVRNTVAEVIDGAQVKAADALAVKALSAATVAQIEVGAGLGGELGMAGSAGGVTFYGVTQARVQGSTLSANDITVLAEGANRSNLIAGSVGGGGVAGVGLSYTINVSGATVQALVDSSTINADGNVLVSAKNITEELAVAATAGVGYEGGLAIAAVVTSMEGLTQASISGNSTVGRRTDNGVRTGASSLTVEAIETLSINHDAGALGGGTVGGVGTAANVVIGRSQVVASAAGSSLTSDGLVSVSALREAEVDMVTATAGGGGFVGISGAVGVMVFGVAPSSDANSELNKGNDNTMTRLSAGSKSKKVQGTGSALSSSDVNTLNAGASYDSKAAYLGASGLHSTSASLSANTVKAGAVAVSSLDKTEVMNNAGSLAVGGLGVSAGVALTTLGGANSASISSASLTSAGGVSVDAGTRELHAGTQSIQSRAIAGAGGIVGLGAAVSLAKNETANSATLSGTVNAGGTVNVSALDETSMRSESYGASVGAISVGVVIAKAEQTGSVLTQVAGSITGQGVSISAQRDATTNAYAKGGSAGVVSGSGAEADATDNSTVKVALASGVGLNAGQGSLTISASSNPYANTEAYGVSVASSVAIGVSIANSLVSSEVAVNSLGSLTLTGQSVNISAVLGAGDSAVRSSATAGAGGMLVGATGVAATSENKGSAKVVLAGQTLLTTAGDVSVSAIDSMDEHAHSSGIGVGYVGIGVATSKASSDTQVAAQANQFKGLVGGVLQITATGNESIDSDAVAGSGGILAGAGADSRVDHTQAVTADLGSGSGNTLTVGSYATVSATRQVRYNVHSTTTTAAAMGASGAVTKATIDGSATARVLDNTKLVADGLRVLATNDLARTDLQAQNAEGGGGGVISGAGADIYTRMNGDALASIGNNASITLEGLLEVRAYNEIHGSSRGQMDVGGAIPIALVETKIESTANADAKVGDNTKVNSYGETHVNALSYIDLEANSVSKTYGLAAAAQGNAYATANVNNRVTIGSGAELISAEAIDLLVGQDKDFNRNKHFVTARVDLFNHAVVPVSINPNADAELNVNNSLTVNATAVRSGATIKLGGIEGSYVVEGKGNVSDWTRDLGELMGLSSEYGSSSKNLNTTATLSGQFEAGFGNKQRLIVSANGTILENTGDVRYTITKEDLSASAGAYVARLYDQLARYGDVPEIRAFVEAELSFYFASLIREGMAESYVQDGKTYYVALSGVDANFLNIKNLRAGSGNIELYGNNVAGNAKLMARADSQIYIENNSPLNLRVFNMTVDANGGFVKYNGTYITKDGDIGDLNKITKSTGLTVDSIDTRGGGASQQLPTLTVKNTFVPLGPSTRGENDALMMTAPDGTSANLYDDEMRAPEMRVNGTLYNKLGTINLSNTAGSISVVSETAGYTPRLDGKEISVTAGKNFMLSSPSISQSVGGSPESLYAVHYSDDQQRTMKNLGIDACGSARPVNLDVSYNANCLVNGAGGIYASGGIFMGARYLNVNGTIQSGQADYNATLTTASVGTQISNWQTKWRNNRGKYLANGTSSMIQVSGPLPTDSEAEINKQFANLTITASQRTDALNAMAARRTQPVIYFDAETNRLKVAPTNVTGGLVELVGSVINTGGGVIRALDGYARMNIDNQTSYGIDLLGLDTGGDKGVVRITDLSKPIKNAAGTVVSYEVTTYEKDANGVFHATVTDGRAPGARVISVTNNALASPDGSVKARFSYNPLDNSTYSWSAGYETLAEKSYHYENSSWLGFIPGGSTSWNSIDTVVKTTNAMPQDIFVSTTQPIGGGNFSMQVKKSITDAETETYYRSWRKCGFLCIKKTYYIERRTEVGYKYLYTQRVAADRAINVELVGYDTGALNVSSLGDIRLGGNISNASGNVSLTSTNGSIVQLSSGAVVEGVGLNFSAKTGIGIQAAPINLITGNGSFTAVSDSGSIAFHSNSGPLRINRVSTTGEVWLDGDGSILGLDPNAVHVTGKKVYLSAPKGGIGEFNADGTVKSTLNIQTADSTFGGLSAYARNGIAIKQPTGNLWVNQVVAGGDVYLETGGDLIDNNRNETRDERTEAQLLALWSSSALQGSSAEASRQATLNLTRTQYKRYWSLRDVRDVVVDGSGNVTSYAADTITPDYKYTIPTDERQKLLAAGVSETQLLKVESDRTKEVLALNAQFGSTAYQTNNDKIIAAVNTANLAAGKSEVGALATWSDAELRNPLPKSIFSKSSTSTQTRLESPNVVGNRVVLRPGGKIGKDDGSVSIPLLKSTRLAQGKPADLTDDEKLVIMAAETDDMSLNRDTWTLTVVKKDNFNVLSNRLNITANGFVYLGADTTDAYPTGGTANLEKVIGTGEIRIKVSDSILSVADAGVSVIQGQKAILEAAQGAIGSAAKPVQMTLRNDATGTLTARAQDGIWIHEIGDMRAADIYTPNSATLSATGAIIDARPVINYPNVGDRTVRSIEANSLTLNAMGGAIGASNNPMVLKVGSGGVNASTPAGYSVYLDAAENSSMTVGNINSGLDAYLNAWDSSLTTLVGVSARRDVFAFADGNMTGVNFTAGAIANISSNGSITGSKVAAGSGSAILDADGAIALVNLGSNSDVQATAGTSIKSTIVNAGRDLSLRANAGAVDATSLSATRNMTVKAYGANADIRSTLASTSTGFMTMEAAGGLSLTVTSAQEAIDLKAGQAMSLLNIASNNSTLKLQAGQDIKLLSGAAKGNAEMKAGQGVQISTASSGTGSLTVNSDTGLIKAQTLTAVTGATVKSTGGDVNLTTVTVSAGPIKVDAGNTIYLGTVKASGLMDLSAGTGLTASSLTSTAANLDIDSVSGLLKVSNASAKTDLDVQSESLTLGTFTAATANLRAASAMVLTTGTTTGNIVTNSQGSASLGSLTSSLGTITADATGAMTVTAAKGTVLDITAGTGLTAGTLTSTTGKIDVDSGTGALKITTATAKTLLDAQAVAGALTIGTYTADTAVLRAGTDMNLTTGMVNGAISVVAGRDAGLGSMTSTTSQVVADATGVMAVTLAKGTLVDLSAGTGLTAGALTSTTGVIGVDSTTGAVKITTATAKGALVAKATAGDLNIGTLIATTADLQARNDLTLTTATTSGEMLAAAGRNAVLGTLTSSGDRVKVDTTGTLTATTVKATKVVDLSGRAGLMATTLTSTSANIDVDSVAGSVNVKTANAITSFAARSYGAMTIGTFGVTAGYASLVSGGMMTLTTGTTTGDMTLRTDGTLGNAVSDSTTQMALGTLTSSAGKIDASNTKGGMTFATLRAVTKIKLDAAKAWSNGQAISGTALYVSGGDLDIYARAGGISMTTLSGKTASKVKADAGSIKISSIIGFSPNSLLNLTATGGGTVSVAYR